MLHRLLRPLFPSRPIQTLSSLDAYARWVATYPPHAHNALMEAEESAMKSLLPDLAGRVVLDLACGTGRYGLLAYQRGAKIVIGLDNSAAMLRANPLKQIALSTSEALPLARESVDVVLCGLALGHLPRLAPTMHEISRVLKSGGTALISDFHPFIFLTGQRRTFTASDGKTYAVEHYPYLYADYQRAVHESGLHVRQVIEPRLVQDSAVHFADDKSRRGMPVVIIFCLTK